MDKLKNRRIGIIGLGVGTIAAYGKESDYIRFYEINPEVELLAREHFTYLARCKAKVDVVIGDARISMEKESPQKFDILAIDAFSSDAVPVHLLTKEALQVYLKHVKPNGIIAFHLSNRLLDLEKVVSQLAKDAGLELAVLENAPNEEQGIIWATWILLTKDRQILEQDLIKAATMNNVDIKGPGIRLWTDDYANLFEIMR